MLKPKLLVTRIIELPITPTTSIMLSLAGKQNQSFTEDELDIIRQSQLAAEESLQHVRTEIKDKQVQVKALELELSVLKSQEYDLIDNIERYSVALSPHNKLPREILRHIFKCCIHEKQVEEIPVTYKGGPYTISHVCSAWRRIALDTPELWTDISLQLREENEKQVRVAREWLSRARALPRSISIKQDSLKCDGWGDNIILNLVVHYPLRSLELTLPHKQLTQLKGILHRSLSTLEVLRLKCFPEDTKMLPFIFRPTDTLPNLNILVLEGTWDLQILNIVSSWSRIVHLEIKSEISAPQCFAILQQCSQIEICSLSVNHEGIAAVSTVPDITLPQIHCFHIYTGGATTKLLVGAVTAPKLKSLSFRLRPGTWFQVSSDVDTTAFCQMIERCQGMKHLTTFRVGLTSRPLNPLILLKKLPRLETIQIDNGILDEDTINGISFGKVGSKLKTMIFKSRHDANEILRMVEVRWQNASQNSFFPLVKVTPFTQITFNCVSVPSSIKKCLICRKNELEKSHGKINFINLTFD